MDTNERKYLINSEKSMNNIITKLRKLNIKVFLDDDILKVDASGSAISGEILNEIRKNKELLIDHLKTLNKNKRKRLIERASVKEYYKLSSVQKRLYFLHEFDKSSLAYNMPYETEIEGELNKDKFSQSLSNLVSRHEILRTSFKIIDGEVVQKIDELVNFEIEFIESSEKETDSICKKFIRPFDLGEAPLIRVLLIKTARFKYRLIFDLPHIISDGTSQSILIKELIASYNNENLSELQLQYKDYSEWEQSEEQKACIQKQKDFWLNEFAELPNTLELTIDYPRPLANNYEGDAINFILNNEETIRIRKFTEKEGATTYMTLMSIFTILLSKLSNQEDIIVGTPIAGRQHDELQETVGPFVKTLALRNYPKGTLSFMEFLSESKSKIFACIDNQDYLYENLVEELNIERNPNRNPLFDIMFAFENYEFDEISIPGLAIRKQTSIKKKSKFDLTLTVTESEHRLFLNFEYCTSLFKQETIELYVRYFKKIMFQVVENPAIKLSEIEIIADIEKQKLLYEFNDIKVHYPKDDTIIEIFEKQVERTPENIALVYEGNTLTYK